MSKRRPLHGDQEEEDGVVEVQEKKQDKKPEVCEQVDVAASSPPHNPLEWLVTPWHFVMVVFYALLLYHGMALLNKENLRILDPEGKIPSLGGRFKFLTHINQWVQLLFFTVQFITDVSPAFYRKPLQKASDVLFTCVAFPLSAMVTVAFWSIYAIDRNLVYPEVFDKFVPLYLNHLWHTTVLLWVLFEIYLFHHHFPSVAMAAACVFVYGSAYICWVVYIYVQTQWWCYPFMKHLPPVFMALFFSGCLFLSLGFHLVGKRLAHVRWGVTTTIQ